MLFFKTLWTLLHSSCFFRLWLICFIIGVLIIHNEDEFIIILLLENLKPLSCSLSRISTITNSVITEDRVGVTSVESSGHPSLTPVFQTLHKVGPASSLTKDIALIYLPGKTFIVHSDQMNRLISFIILRSECHSFHFHHYAVHSYIEQKISPRTKLRTCNSIHLLNSKFRRIEEEAWQNDDFVQ